MTLRIPAWLKDEYWRLRLLRLLGGEDGDRLTRENTALASTIKAVTQNYDQLRHIVPAYGFMAAFDIPLDDRGGGRLVLPGELIRRRTLVVFEGTAPLIPLEMSYEELFCSDEPPDYQEYVARLMKRAPLTCAHDLEVEYAQVGWATLPITEIAPIVRHVYRLIVTEEMEDMPLYKFMDELDLRHTDDDRPAIRLEEKRYFGAHQGDWAERQMYDLMRGQIIVACTRARMHMMAVLRDSERDVIGKRFGIPGLHGELRFIGKDDFDERDKLFSAELGIPLPEIGYRVFTDN